MNIREFKEQILMDIIQTAGHFESIAAHWRRLEVAHRKELEDYDKRYGKGRK